MTLSSASSIVNFRIGTVSSSAETLDHSLDVSSYSTSMLLSKASLEAASDDALAVDFFGLVKEGTGKLNKA